MGDQSLKELANKLIDFLDGECGTTEILNWVRSYGQDSYNNGVADGYDNNVQTNPDVFYYGADGR